MSAPHVILASQSPRRRDLLRQLGIAHEVLPANIDESRLPDELPLVHAERLAREKVARLAARHPGAVVIGADTIVVVDDDVLGKPADDDEAARMLARLSGRAHWVHTAVAVARAGHLAAAVESVEVHVRPLAASEIDAYVATGEPLDKAGAYGIQGYAATFVTGIRGDYFAVMGLPLQRLVALLSTLGLSYRPGALEDAPPP